MKTLKKHKKLCDKVENRNKPVQCKGTPAWKKKKDKEERERIERNREGSERWAEWLRVKGIVGNGNINPLQMFLVYGPAPALEAPNGDLYYDGELDSSSSSDDGGDDLEEENLGDEDSSDDEPAGESDEEDNN